MKKNIIGIYGASGYGKECAPLIKGSTRENTEIVFIDDNKASQKLNGYKILSFEEFTSLNGNKHCSIAIANSQIREKISLTLKNNSIEDFNIKSENTVILDEVEIGDGYILNPFTCLTSNIKIGKYFHANIYSYIAHDCIIGDYVTLAPGAKVNGNIHIHDHAYIGTGAVIKQGTPDNPLIIGTGAVIGMGAVVTKSVPPGQTVVGNPARPIERN